MNIRHRLVGAVAVVATAASGALALLPGTANAATPATVGSPLTISSTAAQAGPLLPGVAKTFDLSVTNHSGAALPVTGALGGSLHGAIPAQYGDVTVGVQAVHAPATTSMFGSQDGGYIGAFYPKGGQWGSDFKLPAHATYTWKITVEAGKAFPINDDGFQLNFGVDDTANYKNSVGRTLDFRVGTWKSGGPIITTVQGHGTLTPQRPVDLQVTFTNRTGQPLAEQLSPWIGTELNSGSLKNVELAFDLWKNGHWVQLGDFDGGLPVLPAHLANGSSMTEMVRVRVVSWGATKATAGEIPVSVAYDGFTGLVTKDVYTVR